MGAGNFLRNLSKGYVTVGLIGLTVTDRYFSIVPIHGLSMSPTFNSNVNNSKGPFLGNIFFFILPVKFPLFIFYFLIFLNLDVYIGPETCCS